MGCLADSLSKKVYLMNTCMKCGVVGGFLLGCTVCGEVGNFARPAQPLCEDVPPAVRDFGPPEGCADTSGPHSRSIRWVSVAASTVATTSTASFYMSPLVAFSAHDTDEPEAFSGGHVPVAGIVKWPPRQV
jgi:hypothetical protein